MVGKKKAEPEDSITSKCTRPVVFRWKTRRKSWSDRETKYGTGLAVPGLAILGSPGFPKIPTVPSLANYSGYLFRKDSGEGRGHNKIGTGPWASIAREARRFAPLFWARENRGSSRMAAIPGEIVVAARERHEKRTSLAFSHEILGVLRMMFRLAPRCFRR